ncbi:MAG: hypothetical protein CM15mP130_0350 [Verrucomicrobiota bacterium]|nr:MAG: hypothetical protein CM15mP130_0350 [Verrucomicrobiota bacterium]
MSFRKEGKLKGDLDLSSLDGMLFGGETSEKVLVPKKPDESLLLTAIEWKDPDYEMPPKENDKLTEKQIQYFREWIELGSPWPSQKFRIRSRLQNAKRSKQMRESSSKIREDSPMTGLTEDTNRKTYGPFNLFRNLKSLLPSRIPSIILSKKVRRNPNKPCPNCRLSFTCKKSIPDLTDSPTHTKFTSSGCHGIKTEKAWDELIDQLMESQHFGERSAQHWLDVARYADTAGLSNDYERSNMWRYRDYVVRSF